MADLNRIQFKRTSAAGRKPDAGTMNPGELAINLADQYLLTKNDGGQIVNLSCPPVYDKSVNVKGRVVADDLMWSNTANYFDDPTARNLDKFGAFRTNDMDGHLALALHIPHPSGINHARGFDFTYGSNVVPTVKTYGYNADGVLAYSYRMYHEGDKPSPSELNVYSKQEVDRMFQKTLDFGIESGWFKIATVYLPQQYGRSAKIRLVGGNGYNVGQTGQANIIELVLRSGNGNPVGVVFNAYMTIWYIDQKFCAIPTGGDSYDIYGSYSGHSGFVLAEYQTSPDVNLTLYDKPQFIGSQLPEAETKFDAYTITSFSNYRNRGTLNFGANSQGQYDIEHLNEQPTNAKKMLRRFRSCAPATIWHETVDDNSYRLATGYEDTNQELLLSAVTGLHVKRLTLDGGVGNAGIDIRRGPNEASHFNFMDYRTGQDVRNGWFGFGDGQTKDFIWWNDNGQNSINLIEDGELHITGGKGQKIVMNSEVALSENARLAVKGGNYGLILRNDGSGFHILTTNLKDSFGSWNNRRPFSYDFADGGLYLGGTETARCLHLGIDGSTRLEDNLFFKAGSRQSMDYMELVHWGASNTGRNNVLSLRDSKGFLAEFERLGDNTIKNTFFGKLKVNRGSDAITINAETGDSSVYLLGTCADNNNWYIGKGGADNGLAFYSYATNAAVNITNGGDIALSPKGIEMTHVNNVRFYVHGERWTASQSGGWNDQWGLEAPIFVDHGYVGPDSYYPIIKGRSLITNQGYTTAVDLGIRRVPNNWGQAIIRVGSAEASPAAGHPQAVFEFHHDGTFYSPGNGNFNDVYIRSDDRLKINKEELEYGALEKVCRLKVYTYDKVKSIKDRSVIKREAGIIAQDLEKELPEAVSKVEVDGSDVLTISNSAVNALLIKAIQEMSEEIKELKTPFFTKIARKISKYFKF
ncbi:long tail fiber protein distal subunit [Escherichia phage MIZ5]|nr:long tail fiber protein distal subunit [Krischvirus RB49]WNA15156.1 long tail fiber protein distal subunit [Krischvirus RB49]